MTDLWTEATLDVDAEQEQAVLAAARVASADAWPFLAQAAHEGDYLNRTALVADHLDRVCGALADGAPFALLRARLEASLLEDFRTLASSRMAATDFNSGVERIHPTEIKDGDMVMKQPHHTPFRASETKHYVAWSSVWPEGQHSHAPHATFNHDAPAYRLKKGKESSRQVQAAMGRFTHALPGQRKARDWSVDRTNKGTLMVQGGDCIGHFDPETGAGHFSTAGGYFHHLPMGKAHTFPQEFVDKAKAAAPKRGSTTIFGDGKQASLRAREATADWHGVGDDLGNDGQYTNMERKVHGDGSSNSRVYTDMAGKERWEVTEFGSIRGSGEASDRSAAKRLAEEHPLHRKHQSSLRTMAVDRKSWQADFDKVRAAIPAHAIVDFGDGTHGFNPEGIHPDVVRMHKHLTEIGHANGFIGGGRQSSLQVEAASWGRRHYEDLAGVLSRHGDGAAAKHFADHLGSTNTAYNPSQFLKAAQSPEYKPRSSGTAVYTKSHYDHIASGVASFPGDKHALATTLAGHLSNSAGKFDHDRFMKAATGTKTAVIREASLFSSPDEHKENHPDTWQVSGGQGRWNLKTKGGDVLSNHTTKKDAEAARGGGSARNLYDRESKWYDGEPVAGWKPYKKASLLPAPGSRSTGWVRTASPLDPDMGASPGQTGPDAGDSDQGQMDDANVTGFTPGMSVTVEYSMPDGTTGTCEAVVQTVNPDGSIAFTYDNGAFTVSDAGDGTYADAQGATFEITPADDTAAQDVTGGDPNDPPGGGRPPGKNKNPFGAQASRRTAAPSDAYKHGAEQAQRGVPMASALQAWKDLGNGYNKQHRDAIVRAYKRGDTQRGSTQASRQWHQASVEDPDESGRPSDKWNHVGNDTHRLMGRGHHLMVKPGYDEPYEYMAEVGGYEPKSGTSQTVEEAKANAEAVLRNEFGHEPGKGPKHSASRRVEAGREHYDQGLQDGLDPEAGFRPKGGEHGDREDYKAGFHDGMEGGEGKHRDPYGHRSGRGFHPRSSRTAANPFDGTDPANPYSVGTPDPMGAPGGGDMPGAPPPPPPPAAPMGGAPQAPGSAPATSPEGQGDPDMDDDGTSPRSQTMSRLVAHVRSTNPDLPIEVARSLAAEAMDRFPLLETIEA